MLTTVGEKIKNLRKEKGLTQSDLARLMNVSKSTIAMYETNKNYPNLIMVKQLCQILETTGDYLIGLVDNPLEVYKSNARNDTSELHADEKNLLANYSQLNNDGKDKAQEYVSDLTTIDKYTALSTPFVGDKVRYVGKEVDTIKCAAYGGGVSSDDDTIKHTWY